MSYVLSVIRSDPWVFFVVIMALSSIAGSLTKGAGFFKQLAAQLVTFGAAVAVTVAIGTLLHRGVALKHSTDGVLEGSFSGSGGKVGVWSEQPAHCLDGRERGFDGVVLLFDAGPVKEIRIDTANKRSSLSVLMDDEQRTVHLVRERDCKTLNVIKRATNGTLDGRPVRRLKGKLQIVCPTLGLEGSAVFDGCLPE